MTAVPHPRTEAAASSPRGGRRSLAAALVLGAVGAAVALLSSRQTWSEGKASVVGGAFPLAAKGSDVTGVPAALAIVGLAALFAVFAVRRAGRVVVSLLLALSGVGIVAAALQGLNDTGALDEKAAAAAGDTSGSVEALTHTVWPYIGALGGLLLLCAGLLALVFGRGWPAMSGRYERDPSPRSRRPAKAVDPDRPEDVWKALDRGEDPTQET
ncbi:hypothetical protein B1H18_32640 [Streptomyces tsukubensis]|uniref:TIGR02234 family membrane protein n=1 Tax=Streptomyces tsukubensis TaxID=83656 RepID=A0A1V3ZZY2_9ACTN|nr:hypothetical protein B1H18_32640 [Streptomyces tsukubensis]